MIGAAQALRGALAAVVVAGTLAPAIAPVAAQEAAESAYEAMPLDPGSIRVIDGDTFAIGETRYRLWGIDAPELDTWQGELSRDVLTVMVEGAARDGAVLACTDTGTRSWERIVARCDVLACALVATGAARDWPKYSDGFYAPCVEAGERWWQEHGQ